MHKTKQPFRAAGRCYRATLLAAAAFACCCGSYAVAQDATSIGPVARQSGDDAPPFTAPLPVAQNAMPDAAPTATVGEDVTVPVAGHAAACAADPAACAPGKYASSGVGGNGGAGSGAGASPGSGSGSSGSNGNGTVGPASVGGTTGSTAGGATGNGRSGGNATGNASSSGGSGGGTSGEG
ncbi:hypothetical protein [Burkholderia ubonensis]|uniref:hypothetical protein n=1 Tax=Burkholderia ubonensis TaxID=101571 RepID=UPI000F5B8B0C|nr:hypothetical protein [Burkholderia ubonensis]